MLRINLLQRPGQDAGNDRPPPPGASSPRIAWLVSFLLFALGLALWQLDLGRPFFDRVDRTIQDGLVEALKLPRHPPVAVTLVQMEDAPSWTALDYSLFLKALPLKNSPVVLFTEMPANGRTAYDRAYSQLAIRQPRLVLPVRVTEGGLDDDSATWWLKGWKADTADSTLVASGPSVEAVPEILRGTTAAGISNVPPKAARSGLARLYFLVGQKYVPSLALRGAMLARRVSDENMRLDHGLMLGDQRLPVGNDATLRIDFSFLPGMRRIDSSDLLLILSGIDPEASSQSTIDTNQLQGVLVLGDLSPSARSISIGSGTAITPAEWVAATVATICNGPILAPAGDWIRYAFLAAAAFLPLIFYRCRPLGKWLGFLLLLIIFLYIDVYLAGEWAIAAPVCLPFFVLFSGTVFHHLASLLPNKTHVSV